MADSTSKLWQYLRRNEPPADTVLILVHGAGPFTFPEWQPILRAIDEFAPANKFDCIGFVYADALPPMPNTDRQAFRARFRREIARERLMSGFLIAQAEKRRRGEKTNWHVNSLGSFLFDLFFALHLDDLLAWVLELFLQMPAPAEQIIAAVHAYLRNKTAADFIRQQLSDALDEASRYKNVVLVSHSLGSVVALDGINRWAQPGCVTNWFTLGSPLSKIRRVRDDGTPNELVYPNVVLWNNLYDTDDLIANPLGPEFSPQVTNEISDKPYVRDIFVNAGDDPVSAHAYYFNKPSLKLIADALK